MPAISTMVYPAPAYVRVETNWADQPQATGAAVYRVDCLTSERVPLRPYVSFSGDYLDLSCGYAVFWDTEPQLDRCVYYCTQALNPDGSVITVPAQQLMADTYTRNTVNGWGPVESGVIAGQVYVVTGGIVGDYSTNGAKAFQTQSTVNVLRQSVVTLPGGAKEFQTTVNVSQVATGANLTGRIALGQDLSNYYTARLDFTTTSTVMVGLNKVIGGTGTALVASTTIGSYAAATQYTIKMRVYPMGSAMAKAWLATDPEPVDWMQTAAITDPLVFTQALWLSRAEVGNTNINPIIAWDNSSIIDVCAPAVAVEACTASLVVPSSGNFRLGDPVRPCNDVTLLQTAQIDPDCVPTQGIFFGNMADEDTEANSNTFLPVNAKYGIWINRERGALASTLTVASKTFADRDALRQLNAPGSLLQLRGPAQYGIYDRYMGVGAVSEIRPVSDHKVQPRVVSLPHLEFARPSGPSTGVCGTRVEDLCDIYPTWDAAIAAGLTYADLLRGAASNATPLAASAERDWAEVLSDFTDWTGTNANNTDWGDVLDGDA